MWILKLAGILILLSVGINLLSFMYFYLFSGRESLSGFKKGYTRHYKKSLVIAGVIAAILYLIQSPIQVVVLCFFVAFISSIFIFLGNDEDDDHFSKL
jgi:hypothetical protein